MLRNPKMNSGSNVMIYVVDYIRFNFFCFKFLGNKPDKPWDWRKIAEYETPFTKEYELILKKIKTEQYEEELIQKT